MNQICGDFKNWKREFNGWTIICRNATRTLSYKECWRPSSTLRRTRQSAAVWRWVDHKIWLRAFKILGLRLPIEMYMFVIPALVAPSSGGSHVTRQYMLTSICSVEHVCLHIKSVQQLTNASWAWKTP